MMTTVSLAQFAIELGDPDKNTATAKEMIKMAANRNSSLVLLPELWTSGYDLLQCARYAALNREILAELVEISAKLKIAIAGSYITSNQQGFSNSFIMVCPDRGLTEPYHKIHLFKPLTEDSWFIPGHKLITVDFSWARVGHALCYDLRFPEMFRVYAFRGVEIMCLVSQWGAPRSEHWRTFLRSRAIENQFFLAAVNAVGFIRSNPLAGCSAVISPWGDTIAEANSTEETLLTAEINLEEIKRVRDTLPAHADSRRNLYQDWYSLLD